MTNNRFGNTIVDGISFFGGSALAAVIVWFLSYIPDIVRNYNVESSWFEALNFTHFDAMWEVKIALTTQIGTWIYLAGVIAFLVGRGFTKQQYGVHRGPFVAGMVGFLLTITSYYVGYFYGFNTWETVSLGNNPPVFGVLDPIFKQDIGFYLATLPMRQLYMEILNVVTIAFLVTGIVTIVGNASSENETESFARGILVVLVSIIGFVGIATWRLAAIRPFTLLTDGANADTVVGIGATDFYVRLPMLELLTIAMPVGFLLIAIFIGAMLVTDRTRWRVLSGFAVTIILSFVFFALPARSGLYQHFTVERAGNE